jgi:hypothetical protein
LVVDPAVYMNVDSRIYRIRADVCVTGDTEEKFRAMIAKAAVPFQGLSSRLSRTTSQVNSYPGLAK